ncbi:MAG: S1/P1 nuclease [Bacteroidetes bacterium]|jgi:hypothetical protein|nr:S1/P1 nuclease [Bacteroidota bacterium]MDA1018586.1 S1/P1 nuclease [Bacteroidota bacterium]|tara:strand:- start:117321 stop:118088 length:768 start_codon:yes stop_codon:yes gene_type:complete
MYRKISILFFIIVSQFLYSNKDIWGSIGHKVIGEIASQNLSSNATNQIEKILDGQSLALVSTWADEMRSNPEFRKYDAWHYVNMPLNKEYPEIQKNNKGDIIQAINKCIVVLKNKKSSNELKSFHLKYLVHLVGDIHQPLHVGRFEDRGGNDIKINFLGKASNLHRVWDSQMIEYYKLDYKSLADELIINKKIKVSINPIDWSYESHQKVKKIYSEIIGIDNINPDYIAINSPFIKSQLHKAGLTLAKVLNDVFK